MKRFYKIYIAACRSLTFFAVISIAPLCACAQPFPVGCLDALRQGNGFKEIKLGADIAKLPGYKVDYLDGDTTMDADSCLKFAYMDPGIREMNNEVLLDMVGFRTYHNKIINIYLFFKRDEGYKVLQDFIATYGECTNKPADFMYDWKSGGVNLSLRYEVPIKLGVAIFTCNPIENKLSLQKQKEKQALALSAVDTKTY